MARYTNADKHVTMGLREREYVTQYARPGGGGVVTTWVQLKREVGRRPERGAAVLEYRDGPVTAGEFSVAFAPDNSAVKEALRLGEHDIQQAKDATTPSNIAILALPLAMNLVPVALIADINTIGMLIYTVLTDVLTAVPLAIKGVEVVLIGREEKTAVVTRITGGELAEGAENKAAEIWIAKCRPRGRLRLTGGVLLGVALGFMVGGIVAEFVAKAWVKRTGGFKHGNPELGQMAGGGAVVTVTTTRTGSAQGPAAAAAVGATGAKRE